MQAYNWNTGHKDAILRQKQKSRFPYADSLFDPMQKDVTVTGIKLLYLQILSAK